MSTCKDCRYCAVEHEGEGYCHRGPPAYIRPRENPALPPGSAWAPVDPQTGWCGEFKRAWLRRLKWPTS